MTEFLENMFGCFDFFGGLFSANPRNKTSPKAPSVRKEEAEASKESIEGPEAPLDSVDDISEILGKTQNSSGRSALGDDN